MKIGEIELDFESLDNEKRLVIELMPEVLPLLKDKIKESSIDTSEEISAASARVPVAYAIVAAYQFRWFATQVYNSFSPQAFFFNLLGETLINADSNFSGGLSLLGKALRFGPTLCFDNSRSLVPRSESACLSAGSFP